MIKEETEVKKDIEWLKEEIEEDIKSWGGGNPDYFRGASDAYENVKDWLNQLDEPGVLSQKWIDDNSVYASSDGATEEYVHVDDLKELLVPTLSKTETVVDVVAGFFKSLERLKEVMSMEVEELEE